MEVLAPNIDTIPWQRCPCASRFRRAEFGTYHHVAGPYLAAYAAEMDWWEDHRRVSNGEQFMMVVAAASHPVSRQWKGYWQRRD